MSSRCISPITVFTRNRADNSYAPYARSGTCLCKSILFDFVYYISSAHYYQAELLRYYLREDTDLNPLTSQGETYMKKMAILAALALVCAPFALAGSNDYNSGPLFPKFLASQNNGIAYVYFQATANGQSTRNGTVPACATDNGGPVYRLAFDSTTPAGKSMLAILLAAHEAGENVFFSGTGDCGVLATVESLLSVGTGN